MSRFKLAMVLVQACVLHVVGIPSAEANDGKSPSVSVATTQPSLMFDEPAVTDEPGFLPLPGRDKFRLDITDLFVRVQSDYQRRRVESTAPATTVAYKRKDTVQTNNDLRFIESTGLNLGGYAYDPALLEYRAAVEFGMVQERWRERVDHYTQGKDDNGFLMNYDINVDMFKTKPVSLNVYAREFDTRAPRRFLPSLREHQTETGASALLVAGSFTSEVGFSWHEIEREGNRFSDDDESYNNTRFWIDNRWQISDTQKLRLIYEHEHNTSTYQGSRYTFETQRDEVRAEHELLFGGDNKHRLDTFFRYNAEKGNQARDELELVPRLTLQHTDRFKTIHRYGLYQWDQGAIKITRNKFDTEAIWDATDKLRLSVDGYGLHERVENDLDTTGFGGIFNAAYRQLTSSGELSANASFGFNLDRTAGDASVRYVRGEAHQLGGSRPVFLRERRVVPHSIVAYNANRTRLYVLGVDYNTVINQGRAVVSRTFTGRIADGEVVYFDYAYNVPANGELRSYRSDFLIEHRFNFGLTPYYALEARCQEVESSAGTPWHRDNQNRHRLGTRYERDRWGIGAEYEIFYDTIEPYNSFHLTGRANVLSSLEHSLDFNAELSRYLHRGDFRRDVWWYDMNVTNRSRLTDYLWFKGKADYHYENNSKEGNINGLDLGAGFELKRGYLIVELIAEYDLFSVVRGRDQGFAMFLNVRRDLSHLLPAYQPQASRVAR